MFSMTRMRLRHRTSRDILIPRHPRASGGGPASEQEMIVGLNGKRVVIFGGTSGIGLATAKAAQGQGAAVVVASSRSQRVESALAALQGKAEGEVVDLADESQVRTLFERLGAFDHLVYSAGETLHLETLYKMQIDQARGFFNLRFWGALAAIRRPAHPRGRVDHPDERRGGAAAAQGLGAVAARAGGIEFLTRASPSNSPRSGSTQSAPV